MPRLILRAASSPWGFALVLGGLSLAFHRDLLPRLASGVPSDPGDPLLNTWILWWNTQAIPFTDAYWNAPIFAPAPYGFALSETLLGLAWLTTPLQWLGASPLVAYNVLVLITPVLNGLSMYWLCLRLTGRRDAAVVGGLAYAFAPYHATQLAHVQTQAMFWMPVALVGLHRYWDTSDRRWLACLAAATALNGLTCGYFLLYFAVLLGLAVLWLTMASGTLRKLAEVTAALVAAALVLVPVIVTYRFVRSTWDLRRPQGEIEQYSADLLSILMGADRLVFWPIRAPEWQLPGGLYPQYPGIVIAMLVCAAGVVALMRRRRDLPRRRWRGTLVWLLVAAAGVELGAAGLSWIRGPWVLTLGPVEISLSRPHMAAGVAMQQLLVAALISARFAALVRSGSPAGLYATGAIAATILSFGPVGRIGGERLWDEPPFTWLMALPGFDATRGPALFLAITVLCLAVLAACAVARLMPHPTPTARACTAFIAAALVVDGWAVVPVIDVPQPIQVALRGDLVVELPRRSHMDDVAAMYRAMSHRRPVMNGYSGYSPPHYGYLLFDLGFFCFDSLDAARGGRSLDVVIWVGSEEARRIDAALLERWGSSVREAFAGTVVYHVPRAPRRSTAAVDPVVDLRYFCHESRPR